MLSDSHRKMSEDIALDFLGHPDPYLLDSDDFDFEEVLESFGERNFIDLVEHGIDQYDAQSIVDDALDDIRCNFTL